MFYNKDVMNSKKFANLWKLAHGLNVSDEELEKGNLTDICEELDSKIKSESNNPHRRLSLRTSAHLLAGSANMYKRKVDQLFEDMNKLNEDLTWRRKRTYNSSSSESTSSSKSVTVPEQMKRANTIIPSFGSLEGSSESVDVPEEMRRATTTEFDTSFSPAKKKKFDKLSKRNTPENITRSKTSTDISSADRGTGEEFQENSEASSSNDIHLSEPENVERPERRRELNVDNIVEESTQMRSPTMIDKGTQTATTLVPGRTSNRTSFSADGFRQNLPFAYIVIHDNIADRVPSKIIISSISYNLNSNH
ncbi:uncharacterized protein LOC126055154 [Helicoverpa armigera]|uniref:uncharacterized protein LOC126055154 n=1 Tax=Helicoverpa armigera TaxID=29058 RepID=UPI0030827D35